MSNAIESGLVSVVNSVLAGHRQAVKYLSPKSVVKATARFKPRRRERHREVLVSVGVPNYRERGFIKAAKKAGEPFPIKKIQLSVWTKGVGR